MVKIKGLKKSVALKRSYYSPFLKNKKTLCAEKNNIPQKEENLGEFCINRREIKQHTTKL